MKFIRLPLLTVTFAHLLTSPQEVAITRIKTIYKQKIISEETPLKNNTVCIPMTSNEKNISRMEDKQIKRVEVELTAVKSHLQCEIANMNSQIESMSNSFVTSLNNFDD